MTVASPKAPRRTQRERREEAEQGLIGAAAEIISESGPASATLARVGERAGYSRGLVAHYFGSKAALMERVADTVSREFTAALLAARPAEGSLLDDAKALVEVYFEVVRDPPTMNRARLVLIADAVAHADSDSREVVMAADREFRSLLTARIAAAGHELADDVDPDALAVTIVGLLRGVTFESMLDPSIDLAAVQSEVLALIATRLAEPARPS